MHTGILLLKQRVLSAHVRIGYAMLWQGPDERRVLAFQQMIYDCTYRIIEKNGSNTDEACHKSHALFSAVHGMISIMMMRNADIPETMNKSTFDESCFFY